MTCSKLCNSKKQTWNSSPGSLSPEPEPPRSTLLGLSCPTVSPACSGYLDSRFLNLLRSQPSYLQNEGLVQIKYQKQFLNLLFSRKIRPDNSSLWDCAVPCRMFRGITGLYPLDESSTFPLLSCSPPVTNENASRHSQISPEGQNYLQL